MHLSTIHTARRSGVGAIAVAGVLAALAAPSQAQTTPVATATSTATSGMTYQGTDARNLTTVTRTGNVFTIDDVVPIKAGVGCAAVAGDPTKVTCTAFKSVGSFRPFKVVLLGGDDSVVNQTGTGNNGLAVGMEALGNAGNDLLVGGDSARDELVGGPGADTLRGNGGNDLLRGTSGDDVLEGGGGFDELDAGSGTNKLFGGTGDDQLDAGSGNDLLDGGPDDDGLDGGFGADVIEGGSDTGGQNSNNPIDGGDVVSYGDRTATVTVDLTKPGGQGAAGEQDEIRNVEHAIGGRAGDTLTGNQRANFLSGNDGEDVLAGEAGQDVLLGGDGDDILFPNPVSGFFFSTPDGRADTMDCGSGRDLTSRFASDNDVPRDCELVSEL